MSPSDMNIYRHVQLKLLFSSFSRLKSVMNIHKLQSSHTGHCATVHNEMQRSAPALSLSQDAQFTPGILTR